MAKKVKTLDPITLLASIGVGGISEKFKRGKAIFRQGDAADAVYYIDKGKVNITVASKQGKEGVIAILEPGEFFGEGCLAGQPLHLATATALSEAVVLRIEKETMVRLLREQPAVHPGRVQVFASGGEGHRPLGPEDDGGRRGVECDDVVCPRRMIAADDPGGQQELPQPLKMHAAFRRQRPYAVQTSLGDRNPEYAVAGPYRQVVADMAGDHGPALSVVARDHAVDGWKTHERTPQSSKMATARVQPAEAPRILWGKQLIVKPVGGSASRLCSFSRWQ